MFRWMKTALGLNDDERQNLTTYSMLGGAMADTVAIALLVYVLRYSWPEPVVVANATLIMGFLFKIIMAMCVLMAVKIIAQAVIAIGGRMKASFGGATIEAEAEKVTIRATDAPPAE